MRAALLALALAGCATGLAQENHPLVGRIWHAGAGAPVSRGELLQHAAGARHVLLGETHDNPDHHRLQRELLHALARSGPPRILAMEQFDAEHQKALDDAQARGANAEEVADAGKFDRKGWNWPLYRPLVEFALEHRWPIVAANLSRSDARAVVADPALSGLPPADRSVRAALEQDMVDGHCGVRPEARRLAGLVEAQRARDAQMARSIEPYTSVLIAGGAHARKDLGVPLYLRGADLVAIAFVEVEPEKLRPQDYSNASMFDYLWFTPRARREDPCASAATLIPRR